MKGRFTEVCSIHKKEDCNTCEGMKFVTHKNMKKSQEEQLKQLSKLINKSSDEMTKELNKSYYPYKGAREEAVKLKNMNKQKPECECCCHQPTHPCDIDTWNCEHCKPIDHNAGDNKMVEEPCDWEDQLKILINDWMFRLIKFGTIDLPKNRQGFMAFECPELADFIRANFIPKKELME